MGKKDLRFDGAGGHSIVLAAAGLAAFVTFLVFIPSLRCAFVNWDDWAYVYENPSITSIGTDLFKTAFAVDANANWHPLTVLSYALDYAIAGLNPFVYHLTNIVIHSLNVFIFFFAAFELFKRAIADREKYILTPLVAATVAALLFGVHPLRVESVTWVSERKDVLSALFFLLGVYAYIKYTDAPGAKRYIVVILLFVLAIMSKPMAVSFPIVLLVLDYFPLGASSRKFKTSLVEKIPFFAISAVSSAAAFWAQRLSGSMTTLTAISLQSRIAVAARAYLFYIYKTVFPFGLMPLYPYPRDANILSGEYLPYLSVLVLITVFCVYAARARKKKIFLAVWLYYVLTLLPVIGIVQVGSQSAADRYTYLPGLGFSMLAGAGIVFIFNRRGANAAANGVGAPLALALSAAVISLFCLLTVAQEAVWEDSVSLWSHEISAYPDSVPAAYYNRGLAYQKQGDDELALRDYTRTIDIDGDYVNAYINRGQLYSERNAYKEAIDDFDSATSIDPELVKPYVNKGYVLLKSGRFREAIEEFDSALELDPKEKTALYNAGIAHLRLGAKKLARPYFIQAADLGVKEAEDYIVE